MKTQTVYCTTLYSTFLFMYVSEKVNIDFYAVYFVLYFYMDQIQKNDKFLRKSTEKI